MKIKYMLKVNENFHDVWVAWFLAHQYHMHKGKKTQASLLPTTNFQIVYDFLFFKEWLTKTFPDFPQHRSHKSSQKYPMLVHWEGCSPSHRTFVMLCHVKTSSKLVVGKEILPSFTK